MVHNCVFIYVFICNMYPTIYMFVCLSVCLFVYCCWQVGINGIKRTGAWMGGAEYIHNRLVCIQPPSPPACSQETLSVISPKVMTSAFSWPRLLSALQIVWKRRRAKGNNRKHLDTDEDASGQCVTVPKMFFFFSGTKFFPYRFQDFFRYQIFKIPPKI